MKILIVIAPDKYREEEFEIPTKALTEAGIGYDVASINAGDCTGFMGGVQAASLAIADAKESDYKGLFIVGGIGARDFLWNDEDLLGLVKQFNESKKTIAAICLAPVVLARARVLDSVKATVFETPASVELLRQSGAEYVKTAVVSDKNIVTANHPTASKQFAEALIAKLTN